MTFHLTDLLQTLDTASRDARLGDMDTCEHGSEGICMLCIREGEGKPTEPPKPEGKSWEDCQDDGPLWDD